MTEAEDNMVMEKIEFYEKYKDGRPDDIYAVMLGHLTEMHRLRDWHLYLDLTWEGNAYIDDELCSKLQEMQ